jgi:hypothetical protein
VCAVTLNHEAQAGYAFDGIPSAPGGEQLNDIHFAFRLAGEFENGK